MKKEINVLMIGPLPPEQGGLDTGGVAKVNWELAKSLNAIAEINLTVFASGVFCNSTNIMYNKIEGVNVTKPLKIKIANLPKILMLFKQDFIFLAAKLVLRRRIKIAKVNFSYSLLALYVKTLVEQLEIDIIHIHSSYDTIPSIFFSLKKKVPLVLTAHGLNHIYFAKESDVRLFEDYKKRYKEIFSIPSKIISISSTNTERALSVGALPKKIVRIPNGININEWKPIPKEDARKKLDIDLDKKIVLFTGNLQKRKGIDILIESFRQVVDEISEVNLIIVGSGEEEKNLKFLTNKLGLHASVKFTGRVSDEELKLWYNACDVYVLPSKSEGLSIAMLEAMSLEKPIITTKPEMGTYDCLIDGENGYFVDYGNIDELAQKIIKILEDNDLAEKFGRKSRELIENEYNWEKIAKQTYNLYREVVSDKNE